jgi:biopolymer transport protein ExbD
MKKKRRRILPRADINVTPFIDILLVLLVIFMTISPTIPTGLDAQVPQQPPPGQENVKPRDDVIVLSVDRNGIIRINQDEVEPQQLDGRIRDIFKSRSDRTIFLQADNNLLFNDVAQVIDIVKAAGAERLGLMTEQISAK